MTQVLERKKTGELQSYGKLIMSVLDAEYPTLTVYELYVKNKRVYKYVRHTHNGKTLFELYDKCSIEEAHTMISDYSDSPDVTINNLHQELGY